MKLVKLFGIAMLMCMAIAFVSCSGEDGERGPQGTAGEQGPAGADGVDGEDGIDGNANVQSSTINMDAWNGGEFFEFDMPVVAEERANYAFLFYLEYFLNDDFARHSVPGAPFDETFTADVNYALTEVGIQGGIITFKDNQGADFAVAPGFYLNLIIISIEINTLEGKNGSTDILAELKAAGVDTNDYNAVAAYFGLD